jgi:hypothetical protein
LHGKRDFGILIREAVVLQAERQLQAVAEVLVLSNGLAVVWSNLLYFNGPF